MLDETEVEHVLLTKFLGMYLDRGITWNSHVEKVCSKLSSGIYVLRQLSKYCPNSCTDDCVLWNNLPTPLVWSDLVGRLCKHTFAKNVRPAEKSRMYLLTSQNHQLYDSLDNQQQVRDISTENDRRAS
ncbi:hypothetical protein J6590_073945 [Homalodisca vitripennis]|nr:hypothetical protein J6590_073945 [Homalodisca vitripennis]